MSTVTVASSMYEDGRYQSLHPTWHAADSAWKATQILRIMEAGRLSPRTVCEVGCGAGEIVRQLSLRMPADVEFSGWEISDAAYQLCQHRAGPKVHFHHGDALADRATYDVIMAIDVVEHIENIMDFLRALRTKATHAIFHIPLDLSVYSLLRTYPMTTRRQSGHLHYFTKETALATLEDAGYRIVCHQYTAGSNELKGNPGIARALLKYPRKAGFLLSQDWTVRVLGGYALMVLAE